MCIFRDSLYVNTGTLLKLQYMLEMAPHVIVDMHIDVVFCLQRDMTIQSEGWS
jgi:hypothetical protein